MSEIDTEHKDSPDARTEKLTAEEFLEKFQANMACWMVQARRVCGNTHDARDIVQDAFIAGFRKRDTLRNPQAFVAWMGKIVQRTALNHASFQRHRMQYSTVLVGDALEVMNADSKTQNPERISMQLEEKNVLRSAILRLREIDKVALILFYFQGRSVADMAELLEAPVGTVKRRLHVARHRLKAVLIGKPEPSEAELEAEFVLEESSADNPQ